MYRSIIFILVFSILASLQAQNTKQIDVTKANWKLVGTEINTVEFQGDDALELPAGSGERLVYLTDCEFENGIIELDIAAVPKYTGLVFRLRDDYVYEGIYFRPQNSSNDDPKRQGHTVQYIASPRYTWYHFREVAPEKYESYADITLNEWFHVKVVVMGKRAEVYVNNSNEPNMVIDDLKYGLSKGSIGLWVGNGSPGTFANLKVTHYADSDLKNGEIRLVKSEYTPEQNYFFDTIKKRQSVRNFKPDPIPQDHIMKILDVARSAPTAGNQQPWKFLVLQDRSKLDMLREKCIERRIQRSTDRGEKDKEKLAKLRETVTEYYTNYLSAPVYVSVLVDSASLYPSYNTYDGANAATLLMIAARALGYGTVYSQDSIPYELIEEVFGIPEQFQQICFTPIGVPVEFPKPRPKKNLYELAVFEKLINGVNYEKWSRKTSIPLPDAVLKEYVGTYIEDEETKYEVVFVDSQLFLSQSGQAKIKIFPEAMDKFFVKTPPLDLTFTRDDDNNVINFQYSYNNKIFTATKMK